MATQNQRPGQFKKKKRTMDEKAHLLKQNIATAVGVTPV
jgi:hypothetical protein